MKRFQGQPRRGFAAAHTGRRQLLRGLGALSVVPGVWLAGCGALPVMPRRYELSREGLQSSMDEHFPVQRRLLEVFDVTISQPRLTLLPDDNRVRTELDLQAAEPFLLQRSFNGELGFTSGLRYEPSDRSIRLTEVRVERFRLDGVPTVLASRVSRLGALIVEELLQDSVVHRLKPEALRTAEGLGLQPGELRVTGRGLSVELVPTPR